MAFKGDWRASKLMGLNVYNEANEKPRLNELLVDKSGKINAVVIGVPGTLHQGLLSRRLTLRWRFPCPALGLRMVAAEADLGCVEALRRRTRPASGDRARVRSRPLAE